MIIQHHTYGPKRESRLLDVKVVKSITVEGMVTHAWILPLFLTRRHHPDVFYGSDKTDVLLSYLMLHISSRWCGQANGNWLSLSCT